jgi:uncharacterized protein YjbI with pentapeptide repeats
LVVLAFTCVALFLYPQLIVLAFTYGALFLYPQFDSYYLWLNDALSGAGRNFLWVMRGVGGLIFLIALIRLGYTFQSTGFRDRDLWDWLGLLVVPAVLTVGGLLFASQQEQRQQEVEDERAQATAYQAYIDQMSRLLTEESLSEDPENAVRVVARAQTLSVLLTVEGERKVRVLRFLAENELIQGDNPIIDLRTADLIGANFEGAPNFDERDFKEVAELERVTLDALDDVNLKETQLDDANLNGIRLRDARLNGAVMYGTSLVDAELQGASFVGATLVDAKLTGAKLDHAKFQQAALDNADLSQASLLGANFEGAAIEGTCLIHADLRGADLSKTGFTGEQLQRAFGNENTKPPNDVSRPNAWSQSIEEQRGAEGFDVPRLGPGSLCDS